MATSSPVGLKCFLLLSASFLMVLLTHSGFGVTAPTHKTHTNKSNSSKTTNTALSSVNLRPAMSMYSVSKTNQMSSSSTKVEFLRGDEDSDPRSEVKSTASPDPSSEYEPDARPENGATSEPSKHGPDTHPEAETWPEPGPRWEGAKNDWKWAWPFHVYLFATIFLFIGFYSGYYVAFNLYDGLQGKYLSVSLNAMALLFGMSRAFVLFFDPYHQGKLIDELILMRLMWSIGGPCLTAADSLIIYALVETAKVTLGPARFQKLSVISGIIAFHFVFVLATDAVVSTYMEAKAMILFCQLFFSVWGAVLGLGYIVLARKLDKKLFSHKEVKDKQDKIYISLVYASGAANLLIVGIMFYTAVGPFGIYADLKFVDAWHWYTLQTMFRCSEVITCILVFTVSAKRSRVKRAVEELDSTVSQADGESSSDLTVMERLRGVWVRLKQRTNRVTPDDTIDEKEEEMLRAAWLGRKPSSPISTPMELNSITLPNQPITCKSPRHGRRQSLFSAMQDASVTSTLNSNVISTGRTRRQKTNPALLDAAVAQSSALKVPSHGSRRKRRLSLFSAMQEASISSTLSENIITTGRTRRETNSSVQQQSDPPVSLQEETSKTCSVPGAGLVTLAPEPGHVQRERRRSLFSALQENKENNVLSHTLVEEDGEEEDCEERRQVKLPSALLKRDSSLRNVFRRIAEMIQPHPVVFPATTAANETTEEGETVKVTVDSPSVSTISL